MKPFIMLAFALFISTACTLPAVIDPATYVMPTAYVLQTPVAPDAFPATWTPNATPTKSIRTPIPPPTQRATITPFDTPAPGPTIKAPTSEYKSQQAANCSIYENATAQYKSNISYYKAYYAPWISMYKKWIKQDVANRDALALERDKAYLEQTQKALNNALAEQRKQYYAIVPAACR